MTSRTSESHPRRVFLTRERRLRPFFYTSNLAKFLQARLVFERNGLSLEHFKSVQEPYDEDYTSDKEQLLEQALTQILEKVGRGSIFFVEDTSVRIEALSVSDVDFPGLRVKEWFASTTFEELDRRLKEAGRNREASVKSDIALHVPGIERPVYFSGATSGTIAEAPPTFEESPQYPWLTPLSFNGWFIPDGVSIPLGQMSLEDSWLYDFRIRALEQLVGRLEEYAGILNMGVHGYVRVRTTTTSALDQRPLFPERPLLIVVGATCAGKTTMGEHLAHTHGYRVVEASGVVRAIRREMGQEESPEGAFEFAKRLLDEHGADLVARRILELYGGDLDTGLAITGFRTIEEVETIQDHARDVRLVLIDATERTRLERSLRRGRSSTPRSLEELRLVDTQQWGFGLLRVADSFCDVRIANVGSLEDFGRQIDSVVSENRSDRTPGIAWDVAPAKGPDTNQIYRCLLALENADRPLELREIERETAKTGNSVRYNNANKVLKRVPELARRIESPGGRLRYELRSPGRAFLRLMRIRGTLASGREVDGLSK